LSVFPEFIVPMAGKENLTSNGDISGTLQEKNVQELKI
jgi:hypothetical protein